MAAVSVQGINTLLAELRSMHHRITTPGVPLRVIGDNLYVENMLRSLNAVDPGGNPWVPFAWDRPYDGGWVDSGGRGWGMSGTRKKFKDDRPATARTREVGDKQLLDTGTLLGSIEIETKGTEVSLVVTDSRISDYGDIPIWQLMQDPYDQVPRSDEPGSTNYVPERAFLGISEDDAQKAMDVFSNWIMTGRVK